MKINVTVDLSDFYPEGEDGIFSFTDQIKGEVQRLVCNSVLDHFKKNAAEEWTRQVVNEVEKQKQEIVSSAINEMISTRKLKKRYSSTDEITVEEYLSEELQRIVISDKQTQNHLEKMVKETVLKIGNELKERYDILFASQIVNSLNKNGMLKEDVAKILLG